MLIRYNFIYILFAGSEAKVPRLKRGAIPSQNLPVSSHDAQVTPEQQARIKARSARLLKRSNAAATTEDAVLVGSHDAVADEDPFSSGTQSCSPGLFAASAVTFPFDDTVTAIELDVCHLTTTGCC